MKRNNITVYNKIINELAYAVKKSINENFNSISNKRLNEMFGDDEIEDDEIEDNEEQYFDTIYGELKLTHNTIEHTYELWDEDDTYVCNMPEQIVDDASDDEIEDIIIEQYEDNKVPVTHDSNDEYDNWDDDENDLDNEEDLVF